MFHEGAEFNLDFSLGALALKQVRHVARGSIAKELSERLLMVRNSMALNERDHVRGSKARERGPGKMRIFGEKFSAVQCRLVKLQRPPPEIRTFFPTRSA